MLTQAKAYLATARKTIFSFSRRPEKMFFPKKSRCNMIFLVLLRKIKLLFLENMILTLGRKWKMIFFKKKYKEIWYFLQAHRKEGLLRRGCAGTWSFLYYLKGWYIFSWKHDIFSWAESQRWLFSRNTWKYDIFCVHVWVLQAWCHAPCQK